MQFYITIGILIHIFRLDSLLIHHEINRGWDFPVILISFN